MPRKGAIRIGADADLVVLDVDTPRVVRASDIGSVAGYSLYEGRSLRGWPTFVSVRGRPVLVDGRVDDTARGHGRYVSRAPATNSNT